MSCFLCFIQSKNAVPSRGEYNVYSTFQSHEPEFDYLKSLEIEEKINKIRWLRQTNRNHFLLSTNGKRLRLHWWWWHRSWFKHLFWWQCELVGHIHQCGWSLAGASVLSVDCGSSKMRGRVVDGVFERQTSRQDDQTGPAVGFCKLKNEGPLWWEPRADQNSPFKVWSRSKYSSACFAHC